MSRLFSVQGATVPPEARFRSPKSHSDAKTCQKNLARWYLSSPASLSALESGDEARGAVGRVAVMQCFQMLGDDAVALADRMEQMEPYEHQVLDGLRDVGASVPELIDYIRAESGFNPDGRAIRKDVATNIRQREFKEQSARIEARWRSGLVIAGGVVALGIVATMIMSGQTDIIPLLPKVLGEPLKWAWEAMADTGKGLALGGSILLAWKTYKQVHLLRTAIPKLDIGKEEDFKDLPASLGNPNFARLNAQYESVPVADQYLIKHLSPTELRFFLLGGDMARTHILRSNPPTQRALLEREVEQLGRDGTPAWLKLTKATWTLFSYPLSRKARTEGVPDLRERLKDWRMFAETSRQAAIEEQMGDLSPRAPTSGPNR